MRSWPSPVSPLACSFILLLASCLVACSFDTSGPRGDDLIDANPLDPDAGIDAFFPGDDGGGMARTIRQDTVADFGNGDAVLDSAIVEPWGAIGPAPQVVGALYARGFTTKLLTSKDGRWEDIVDSVDSGHNYMSPSQVAIVGNHPVGLGITADNNWSVLFEGEIWLEVGTHHLKLAVDDYGFVDLADPGTSTFKRAVSADFNTAPTFPFEAKTTGWYPIHVAAAQAAGGTEVNFSHEPPAPNNHGVLPVLAYRLRAPLKATVGLLAQGFDNSAMVTAGIVLAESHDGISVDYGVNAVPELGIGGIDNFAVRWSGQFRIGAAGDHRFAVDSDDGQRLWIDGKRVLDAWPHTAFKQTSGPVTLDVGWHDIVVDLREDLQESHMIVEIIAPSGDRVKLPAAQLRPTLVRSARVTGDAVFAVNKTIPDNSATGASVALAIDPIADLKIEHIDGDLTITHSRREDLEIALRGPDGTEKPIFALGAVPSSAVQRVNIQFTTDAFNGQPVGGTWTVIVRDRVSGRTEGTFHDLSLAIHARGGESPVATHAIYASKALDLGKVVGFDRLTYVARTPAGTSVVVKARTCETVDACSAEKWSDAIPSGSAPVLPLSRRFFQYQVELTTSGDSVPALDSLELVYRAAP